MSKLRSHGFTLIELIIFIVVVSAGLAGILSVMNNSVARSADPMIRKQTMAIAESLLEEILLKDFAKPVGSTALSFAAGGARATFDCVADYDTYSTTGGVRDILGAAVSGLTNYNITSVAVSDVVINTQTLRQVVVTVTGPQNTVIVLTGHRGNY